MIDLEERRSRLADRRRRQALLAAAAVAAAVALVVAIIVAVRDRSDEVDIIDSASSTTVATSSTVGKEASVGIITFSEDAMWTTDTTGRRASRLPIS